MHQVDWVTWSRTPPQGDLPQRPRTLQTLLYLNIIYIYKYTYDIHSIDFTYILNITISHSFHFLSMLCMFVTVCHVCSRVFVMIFCRSKVPRCCSFARADPLEIPTARSWSPLLDAACRLLLALSTDGMTLSLPSNHTNSRWTHLLTTVQACSNHQ